MLTITAPAGVEADDKKADDKKTATAEDKKAAEDEALASQVLVAVTNTLIP